MLEEQSERFQDTVVCTLIVWPYYDRCQALISLGKHTLSILDLDGENLCIPALRRVPCCQFCIPRPVFVLLVVFVASQEYASFYIFDSNIFSV